MLYINLIHSCSAEMSSGFLDPYQKRLLPQMFAIRALQVFYFLFLFYILNFDQSMWNTSNFIVIIECLTGPIFKIQLKFRRLEIPPHFNVNHLGDSSLWLFLLILSLEVFWFISKCWLINCFTRIHDCKASIVFFYLITLEIA